MVGTDIGPGIFSRRDARRTLGARAASSLTLSSPFAQPLENEALADFLRSPWRMRSRQAQRDHADGWASPRILADAATERPACQRRVSAFSRMRLRAGERGDRAAGLPTVRGCPAFSRMRLPLAGGATPALTEKGGEKNIVPCGNAVKPFPQFVCGKKTASNFARTRG